jgi:acylglycerol lipase
MLRENYQVYSAESTQLFSVCWRPKQSPKAVLFIVHGLGEHLGRYEEMASQFVENQIAIFTFDHRGHGYSEGKKGHARSIEQFIEDVEHVLMKCRSIFLDLPIFLFGHSMGGQIVAAFLDKVKSKEIAGAIISSPWIGIANPPTSWKIQFAKRMGTLFPSLTIANGLNSNDISGVMSEVEKYKQDPLIHNKVSLSLFNSLFANGQYLEQFAKAAKVPVLVCHGAEDEITNPETSEKYANRLGEKASFRLWKKARHEPHHDFEKALVVSHYIEWVLLQIKNR